jgi:hypothetical protein
MLVKKYDGSLVEINMRDFIIDTDYYKAILILRGYSF